jgi:phosphomannomutase
VCGLSEAQALTVDAVQHPENPEKPLAGLHILVDAGNGAGGFFVPEVLQRLGADTTGSQFLEPDGMFPNHVPNPEDPAAMAATIDAVNKHGADLGIVFDTDVDRSGVVDRMGRAVNKNKLIALMAAITLRDAPESTIVTDSVTSSGLTKFIHSLGGKHFRCASFLVVDMAQSRLFRVYNALSRRRHLHPCVG